MTNTIKCTNCGREIEVTQAFRHQIEEQVLQAEQAKHQLELEHIRKQSEASATQKAKAELETSMKRLREETEDEKARSKNLEEQLLGITKELRLARQEKQGMRLEMEKKLLAEEEKIRNEARKQTEEEHQQRDLEKDKKLTDALKMNEDLKRRLEQGSQQTQGEVLELELEQILRSEFPGDEIQEVKKGIRGADILEIVKDKRSRECGIILWESKNAKWSETWIPKLREDQRHAKAQLAVLVSINLPDDIKTFAYREGVWVTSKANAIGLAWALRYHLVKIFYANLSSLGKNEKMEVIYQYLTGTEFHHRVEAIVEAFSNLQEDIEKEKRWFTLKWARQEKEIRKIVDNTHGLYGDLQGVTGRALPQIASLEPANLDGEILVADNL